MIDAETRNLPLRRGLEAVLMMAANLQIFFYSSIYDASFPVETECKVVCVAFGINVTVHGCIVRALLSDVTLSDLFLVCVRKSLLDLHPDRLTI